jgi:4-alpha-glucanotransferase
MVMDRFLESNQFEVFTLKSQFDTQKKIEIYFNGAESDIKDALMALVGEVLFIEDPIQNGKFHPKISAQFTYSYKALSEESKRAFNTLYDNFFYKRHNHFWGEEAMKKLPQLISSTNMLTCAEDLGMIPDCVPEVVNNLKMLSLEIQRMPKDPKMQFALPSQYPYLSVATTGTHDTSTIRGWWEESEEIRQSYFNTILHEKGKAPFYCEPWICEKIINQHIHSSSMLVILPLQDWLSTDGSIRNQDTNGERINNPANPKHYWRYRMHLNIEELLRYVTNITTPCHIGG